MPVLPASASVTIPQPLEPDIEVLRQSGNLSSMLLFRPDLLLFSSASNCSSSSVAVNLCFNASDINAADETDSIAHPGPQWAGLVSQGLIFYVFPTMVAFGVLGGLVSIYVLVRQTNRSSYDAYLIWIVSFGVVLLLCGATLRLTDYTGHNNTYQYVYGYVRSVNEWLWYSSVWTLVMMTLENILATRFRWRNLARSMTSGWRQACAVSCIVCVVCLVSSLPHFFEYEVTETFDYVSNQTLVMCQLSDEAKTYEYATIYYWYIIALTIFFPLPLLLIILSHLVRGQLRRRPRTSASNGTLPLTKPSDQPSTIGSSILIRKVTEDTLMDRLFVVLIVLYVLLTGPLALLNCINGLNVPQWTWTQDEVQSVVYPLSEFAFYCYFVTFLPLLYCYNDRFHQALLRTLCCRRCTKVKPQKTVKFDVQTIEIEIRC